MIRIALVVVALTSSFAGTLVPRPQTFPPAQHPSFAGVWEPSEPARSDVLFDNGLGWIPGNGRLTIEQRPDRFTVTRQVPDDKMDPILDINGRYYPTIVFRIVVPRGRAGGFGAAGDSRPSSWQGDRLVFHESNNGNRPYTMTFSLDGERLKMETHAVVGTHENNFAEWFKRVQ